MQSAHLARTIRAKIAQILDRDESAIDLDASFDVLDHDIHETLDELVQEIFGRPFYRWELEYLPQGFEKPDSIKLLASYLAKDVEIQAPETGFTAPYEGGSWSWELPTSVSEGTKRNQPIAFILSTARSGSTILRTMLDEHPKLFSPPELYLLPFDNMVERKKKVMQLGYPWMLQGLGTAFDKLQWPLSERRKANNASTAQVYGVMQEQLGERVLVDKTPPYAAHPGWLQRAEGMFAEPKYLFLARHPYAVIESFVRMRFHRLMGKHWLSWDENPWLNAEKHWAVYNRNILDFLEGIEAGRKHLVYYEGLVTDPRKTMNGICEFFGFPFHESALNPYSGSSRDFELGDPNLRNHSSVDPALATAWQKKRPPQELSDFTKRVADELGYQYTL